MPDNKPVRFLCRLGFHRWGWWSEGKPGTSANYQFGLLISKHDTMLQERFCIECNKSELRRIG